MPFSQNRWTIVISVLVGLIIGGAAASGVWYQNGSTDTVGKTELTKATAKVKPAKVEAVAGTSVKRVTLTAEAAKRINVQTSQVRDSGQAGAKRMLLPYAAVLYDRMGEAYTYTNPEPLVFLRQRITIDRIDKDDAILSAGPPVGTLVVTTGAAELYGSEMGIG
jgi:hypothetical protein